MALSRPQSSSFKVIVAIDFGTTYTGYAYYYNDGGHDYDGFVKKICVQQSWPGNVGNQEPTTVLLTPEKRFHSFGSKAERKYKELALDNNHSDWYYFRHFKMVLHHKKDFTNRITLEDDTGRSVEAMYIFEYAIREIREHLETRLKEPRVIKIEFSDIRWVITVPAIWRYNAKGFMREAAVKGGIPGDALRLAIEPEAAAIYCKKLVETETKESISLKDFNPKSKYIILDLGGGTVDITVHEVQDDGTLKEIHAATGEAWGGQLVDEAFTKFIANLVTKEILRKCQENHTFEWIEFLKAFDSAKKEFNTDTRKSIIGSFPLKMIEIYDLEQRKKLPLQISQTFKTDEVDLRGNTLILGKSIMMSFFDEAINPICEHVQAVIDELGLKRMYLDFMILVGGFSESSLVKNEIERKFGTRMRIVTPEQRKFAVLKGAVMYGMDPSIISSRISPYSYGVSTQKKYNSKEHPEERMKKVDGKEIVNRAYDEHIEKGQEVHVGGETKAKTYTVLDSKSPRVFWRVYQSTKPRPKFCDEKECKYIATLSLTIPEHLRSKKVSLSVWMKCVGTELVTYATAADARNSKVEVRCQCQLDFLGQSVESASDFTESIN